MGPQFNDKSEFMHLASLRALSMQAGHIASFLGACGRSCRCAHAIYMHSKCRIPREVIMSTRQVAGVSSRERERETERERERELGGERLTNGVSGVSCSFRAVQDPKKPLRLTRPSPRQTHIGFLCADRRPWVQVKCQTTDTKGPHNR